MYYQSNSFFSRGLLTPAVRFLLIATGAMFLVQLMADGITGGRFMLLFSLSRPGIEHLYLWQFVTYLFLHGGLLHLLLNMLGLFFFGPETERAIGTKRFTALYFLSGILGGLGWLLISGRQTTLPCLGASGAIFGILGAFAALFPKRPITMLLFFIVPVTMQARSLAIALALFSLFAIISQPGQIAYAAHLIGGLAGYGYIVFFHSSGPRFGWRGPRNMVNDLLWRWHRRKFKIIAGPEGRFEEDHEPPARAEVDKVLEKLARHGMDNLTRAELDILKRASRTWRRK